MEEYRKRAEGSGKLLRNLGIAFQHGTSMKIFLRKLGQLMYRNSDMKKLSKRHKSDLAAP